jgi:predicted transcriptional regulator
MAVDRLSVTVPAELGAELRALAEKRGQPVSALVTEAIARQVRLAALDRALSDADRRFGSVPEELVADAAAELVAARGSPRKRKAKRRR